MAFNTNINAVRFLGFTAPTSSASREEARVIEAYQDTQALVAETTATTGSATGALKAYVAQDGWKTTVNAAKVATNTTLELVGDAGVNDTLNGITITTSDFVLVKLDTADATLGSWQLFTIGSLGGATAGIIDINSMTTRNGTTGLRAAVSAGNLAYVIRAGMVSSIVIGAATINRQNWAVGSPSAPLVIGLLAGGATAHHMTGVTAYMPVQ